MINNINKTNNYLSPQPIVHNKRSQHITLEIQVLAWDRYKNVVGLNLLIGSLPLMIIGSLPLLIIGSLPLLIIGFSPKTRHI
jgi:hypothetical protein